MSKAPINFVSQNSHAFGRVRVGVLRTACVAVACVAMVASSAGAGEAPEKKSPTRAKQPTKQSSKQSSKQPAKQAKRQSARQPTKQARKQPTRRATPKPAARPSSKQTRERTRQPVSKPAARPATRPTSKPTTSPSRRPAARPASKPTSSPGARPSRPSARPSARPASKPTSTRRPTTSTVTKDSASSTTRARPQSTSRVRTKPTSTTQSAVSGASDRESVGGRRTDGLVSKKGAHRLSVMKDSAKVKSMTSRPTVSVGPGHSGDGVGVVTVGEVPAGFAPEKAVLLKQRGYKSGGLVGLDGVDVGSGAGMPGDDGFDEGFEDGFDEGFDDGYEDGYDDGYEDGYEDEHGHHHHHGHSTHGHHVGCYYCTNSWYLVIRDYNGDGYLDYACTNSFTTVWYYGGFNGFGYGFGSGWGQYSFRYSFSTRYRGGYGYYSPYQYRGPVYGPDQEFVVEGEQAGDEIEEGTYELSPIEVARLFMSVGALDDAIVAYGSHLDEYPDDWFAIRELGIAKMLEHQYLDGVALIHYAYSGLPELAGAPIEMVVFEDSEAVLRDLVLDMVRWGHKSPSAGAWLTVGALMQAQGREPVARKMIDRAADHGLDIEIVDSMFDELDRY